MIRRPFLTAAVTAALYATVLVSTASAQLHNVRVTLVTGQVMTVQVEVPEGATATAAQIPPLPAPTQTIEDLGPVQVPTVVPTPQVPLPDGHAAGPEPPRSPTPAADDAGHAEHARHARHARHRRLATAAATAARPRTRPRPRRASRSGPAPTRRPSSAR